MTKRTRFLLLFGVAAAAAGSYPNAYSFNGPRWPSRQVPYYVNGNNADVSVGAAEAAVQVGAATWSQTNSDFSFYYMGRTSATTASYNGKNEVFFRNTSNGGIVAETYWWRDQNNNLLDADIMFYDGGNTFFTVTSGCSGGVFIEEFAAHEFGHALGLDHSSVPSATMYYSGSWCSNDWRYLDPDDIAGVEALYPPTNSNTAPVVNIASPQNGATTNPGSAFSFSGSATDREDGTLSNNLSWRSNIDGQIGTGASFSRALSSGNHVVTASVTDSRGFTSSQQVSLSVASANTAPTVTISSPAANASVVQGTAMTFTGSASDQQDGNISSRLVWTSSRDGQIGTGASFSRVLSAGSHTIQATATDNAGASGSRQVSVTVTVATNSAPSVSISTPESNTWVDNTVSVGFSALAWDNEEGNISNRLVWDSSVDGPIGMGGSFSRTLSPGTHTITARVTDGSGLAGAKQVSVSVTSSAGAPPPPTDPLPAPPSSSISLSVRAYKVKGVQRADLTWSGASGSSVDVYRNGVKVTTTANDGVFTDALNRKGAGSYSFTVCNAGTNTCSAAVVASF